MQLVSTYSLVILYNSFIFEIGLFAFVLLDCLPAYADCQPTHFQDLKNTSDDAIPNYLNSLKFRQSHTLTDVRLALGYTAFGVAAACFLWDYKLGFESTKYYTAAAVTLYTLINGALTLWIMFREKGVVYEGTSPSGEKVRRSYSYLLCSPVY